MLGDLSKSVAYSTDSVNKVAFRTKQFQNPVEKQLFYDIPTYS